MQCSARKPFTHAIKLQTAVSVEVNMTAAQKVLKHFLYFCKNQQEMSEIFSVVNFESYPMCMFPELYNRLLAIKKNLLQNCLGNPCIS